MDTTDAGGGSKVAPSHILVILQLAFSCPINLLVNLDWTKFVSFLPISVRKFLFPKEEKKLKVSPPPVALRNVHYKRY